MTATLAAIWRHPIKGHGRERLARVDLAAGQTLPHDREWAVLRDGAEDPAGAWVSCGHFTRGASAPALMAITAKLDADACEITLSHPAQGSVTFDPDGAVQTFLDWARQLVPADRAGPVAVVRAAERGMTDTDFPSISIGNLASLRALSARVAQDLSPDRFRANLWIEGLNPWAEFDLVGRDLVIGDAVLSVAERITRCRATEANPETGLRDAETLRGLQDGWGHKDFGIYATVTAGGTIAEGDTVRLA